ncbi:MAG: RDD family protein [Chitinophagaceae bacterium]|nr:RDD family protein [Chitinophagaceae bacterium]
MQTEESLLDDFQEPDYKFVGFWSRFGARFIDGIILRVFSFILSAVTAQWGSPYLVAFTSLLPLFYQPVMEYIYGASVGKMALGIKVVNYDLEKLTLSNVVLRNILYFALQFTMICFTVYYYYIYDTENSVLPNLFNSLSDGVSWAAVYAILLAALFITEIIFLLTDEKFRALHDRIGKTYVVKKLR